MRLPCLGGARRKPGKGTPVRVGTLPMKSECVHTKALTLGRGGATILRGNTEPKTLDNIVFRLSQPFEPPVQGVNPSLLVFCWYSLNQHSADEYTCVKACLIAKLSHTLGTIMRDQMGSKAFPKLIDWSPNRQSVKSFKPRRKGEMEDRWQEEATVDQPRGSTGPRSPPS